VSLLLAFSLVFGLDPHVGRDGDIAHTGSTSPYLAIPLGPGFRVAICGPGGCLEATSTDGGPNHAMLVAGRIADLDIPRWERVCGVPASAGLCPGSWRVVGTSPTLPPTDTSPIDIGTIRGQRCAVSHPCAL
jgi:hypothetical protein